MLGRSGLLERDEPDLRAPLDVLGAVLTDESRQRMQATQALVAGGGATAAVLFQMGEELTDQFRRQVDHRQAVDGFLRCAAA